MTSELGKIEKPTAESFQKGRKLYFVPLIYADRESPAEYLDKYQRYWHQVEGQLRDLEAKLGPITRVFHELVPLAGDEGLEVIKTLNEKSYQITKARLEKGAKLEALEDVELQAEWLDWNRCLSVSFQSLKVFTRIYELYKEVSKKRSEHITRRLDEALGENESALLFLREGQQVQFPPGVEVFYIAPPALDDIKRWLRDREAAAEAEPAAAPPKPEEPPAAG